MSKVLVVAHVLNVFLLLILSAAIAGFISFGNLYGLFLVVVTATIAWGVFKHKRWGYFAAAVWALACYQLSKQGYEFQAIKREVMILGFCLIPVALFLHETLGKRASKTIQTNGSDDDINRNMHD